MEDSTVFTSPWYSLTWFFPSTLSSFEWKNAIVLYALMIVPIGFILRWLWRYKFSRKLPVALSQKQLKSSPLAWLRIIPDILLMIVFILLVVALARPQRTSEQVEQWTEGIDIVVAIDISRSMQYQDFRPDRLTVAKKVADDFISGRSQDRIGIVVFSGEAFSLAPLTTDYRLLKNYLEDISFDMITNGGTAIGSALAVATNRMRESEAESKVIILLSDGDNTAGNIDPITAAELAAAYGIKIYTILIGREGLVPAGPDIFGRQQMIENTVDETVMKRIAAIGAGEFYRATDTEALVNVFERIDRYEKAEIKETRFRNTTDHYVVYLNWGILFLLLWLLSKSSFVSNPLLD